MKKSSPLPQPHIPLPLPVLEEGDTADKRDRFRALLKERGYRVGHVTIDTSDWYVSQRFVDRLSKQPNAPLAPYRDYLTLICSIALRSIVTRTPMFSAAIFATRC